MTRRLWRATVDNGGRLDELGDLARVAASGLGTSATRTVDAVLRDEGSPAGETEALGVCLLDEWADSLSDDWLSVISGEVMLGLSNDHVNVPGVTVFSIFVIMVLALLATVLVNVNGTDQHVGVVAGHWNAA